MLSRKEKQNSTADALTSVAGTDMFFRCEEENRNAGLWCDLYLIISRAQFIMSRRDRGAAHVLVVGTQDGDGF